MSDAERQALLTRAAAAEIARQAAVARGDYHAVKELEIELSRLYARYRDVEMMDQRSTDSFPV